MMTDDDLRRLRPTAREVKHRVAPGLFAAQLPSGVISFRAYPVQADGKRVTAVLGRFPELTVADAIERLAALRRDLDKGMTVRASLEAAASRRRASAPVACQQLYDELIEAFEAQRSPGWKAQRDLWWRRFLRPEIGALPAQEVTGTHILRAMQAAERAVSRHAAHSVRQLAGAVLDRAVIRGIIQSSPARSLARALPRHTPKPRADMTLEQVRWLYANADRITGSDSSAICVKVLLLTVLRVGELVKMVPEWIADVDTLVVPAQYMKMKRTHRVPLGPAASYLLNVEAEAKPGQYLFPGFARNAHMTPSGLHRVFQRAFGAGGPSPHSVRNAFSTWAAEAGWQADLVELQLAHVVGSKVRAAYQRSDLLEARRPLAIAWEQAIGA